VTNATNCRPHELHRHRSAPPRRAPALPHRRLLLRLLRPRLANHLATPHQRTHCHTMQALRLARIHRNENTTTGEHMSNYETARITITRTINETGEDIHNVWATDGNGDQLPLIESLGMLRMAEDSLLHTNPDTK